MKKFGLRAVAASLAILMVTSVFAPAKAANAEDVLLVAKAPKTLVITADMVDDDGEVVISNEDWDRIVVGKEVDAKDIYFDGVDVKELVVESGGKSRVQLWEVDAEQVTVQEPEIAKLTLTDLRPLLEDEATRQLAIDTYKAYLESVDAVKKNVPSVVTNEGAKVDTLVARANVTLDLAEGDVEVVALEANEKFTRTKVTLKNYDGDVTYKGNDSFSYIALNAVNSNLSGLTVEASSATNYLDVVSKDSKVAKAEVAGNANVAFDVAVGTLEVSEKASAAQVSVLATADELKVAAKGAKVELLPNATVTSATVTADNVSVTGAGSLKEANLLGTGAYVSTFGTAVEGENTYIPYQIPLYDSWFEDFSDAELVAGVPTDGGSMNWASYKYDAENGYGVVTTTAGWQGFAVELDNRDNGSPANFTVSLRVKKLGGATDAVRVTENPAWTKLADNATIGDYWTYIKAEYIPVAAGATRVIMIAPEVGQAGVVMEIAVDDVKVERYTEWTEPPARPKPTENVTYDFTQMTLGTYYGVTTTVQGGALNITYDAQYQEAQYNLPAGMFTEDYDRIVVHMSECTGTVDFKIIAGGKNIQDNYGKDGTCIIDLSNVPGYEVTTIGIMQDNEGSCSAVIEGFTFVVAGTDYELPAEPPKAPAALPEDYLVYDMAALVPGAELTNVGGLALSFDKQYAQTNFTLPEAINVADYEKMIITLSSATGAVAFKTYDGGTETKAWYGKSATKTTDIEVNLSDVENQESKVSAFAVMANDGACDAVVYRVAFVPKKAQEEGVKTTYTFKELTQARAWDATASVDSATGAVTMTFPAQWKQLFYEIPEAIDMTKVESVTLNGLVGSSYCIKLQTAEEYAAGGDAVVVKYDNSTVASNGTAIKYIVFMSNSSSITEEAPQVIAVESVTFNMKEAEEEEKITEFYIATDVAFTDVEVKNDGNGNINANLPDLYLDSDNFKNKLPEALKADETIAAKFTTLEGIVEMVDYFEVEVTLTDATAATEDIAGYAPQAQVYIQSSDWSSGTWGKVIGNIGQPSADAPKSGTFEHSTELIASWTSPTIAKIGIQIINALENSQVSGSYSVKVVLK